MLRLISLLSFSGLALAPLARAENTPAEPPAPTAPGAGAPGQHGHRDRGGMHDRLKDLSEKLQLTDAQKEQVKGIFSASEPQMKALWDDESLSPEDRRAKMQAIRKSTHDQIRALLTPDQQKTFDAMPKPERGHRGPPKGDGNAPPVPKPQ